MSRPSPEAARASATRTSRRLGNVAAVITTTTIRATRSFAATGRLRFPKPALSWLPTSDRQFVGTGRHGRRRRAARPIVCSACQLAVPAATRLRSPRKERPSWACGMFSGNLRRQRNRQRLSFSRERYHLVQRGGWRFASGRASGTHNRPEGRRQPGGSHSGAPGQRNDVLRKTPRGGAMGCDGKSLTIARNSWRFFGETLAILAGFL